MQTNLLTYIPEELRQEVSNLVELWGEIERIEFYETDEKAIVILYRSDLSGIPRIQLYKYSGELNGYSKPVRYIVVPTEEYKFVFSYKGEFKKHSIELVQVPFQSEEQAKKYAKDLLDRQILPSSDTIYTTQEIIDRDCWKLDDTEYKVFKIDDFLN